MDVSITHIMGSAANHTSQPRPRQGNSVPTDDPIAKRETEKNNKYKAAAAAVHKEFIPLVMDTYGQMDKPFLNLLKDVATRTAHRASITPPNELRKRIHLRNLALIHVALITSLMQGVAGSTVTNDRQHGARHGIYGSYEHYVQPYPVITPQIGVCG